MSWNTREDVTDEAILAFIRRRIGEVAVPPSVRELGAEFGMSTGAIKYRLDGLVDRGLLRRTGVARGLVIVEEG